MIVKLSLPYSIDKMHSENKLSVRKGELARQGGDATRVVLDILTKRRRAALLNLV